MGAMQRISVVGIGKLGICMAACFAAKGYNVTGVDINEKTIELVNRSIAPVYEPGLQEKMGLGQGRLVATSDFNDAILNSDVTFVVVNTPSLPDGSYSVEFLKGVLAKLGSVLRNKAGWHLIAVTSTILPGTLDSVLKPLLEEETGKVCGEDFGLCYNPEFIALGSVLRDFTHPDFVLIGEYESKSGEILSSIYREVCENKPPIKRMTPANAELAKIAFNSYVTMKISFANTIADLCERLPGGDVDVVTDAIGSDSRIGVRYLKGGLAFGGPCFPRDNRALAYVANRLRCPTLLAETTDKVNHYQIKRVADMACSYVKEGGKIAVLGITYKSNTSVVDESASLAVVSTLASLGMKVAVYDPAGLASAKKVLGDKVKYCSSLVECLEEAELCILATPWDEFKDLNPTLLKEKGIKTVLDCWRVLNGETYTRQGVRYCAIGRDNR